MNLDNIEIIPKKVLRYNKESNYGIVACITDNKEIKLNRYNNITITGVMPELTVNHKYIACLEEMYHKKYGLGYKVKSIKEVLPTTFEEEKEYLKALLTDRQINEIYKVYPDGGIIDLMAEGGFDYTRVNGIGKYTYDIIKEKVIKNLQIQRALTELKDYDITFNMILKLLNKYLYVDILVNRIKENPYILADEVNGIGFVKCDVIALKAGVVKDSPFRIGACIKYYLTKEAENNGHSWISKNRLMELILDVLDIDNDIINQFLQELLDKGSDLYNLYNSLYFDGDRVALQKNYFYEKRIYNKIIELLQEESQFKVKDIEEKIKIVETKQGFEFTDEQKQGIYDCIENNLIVINGRAGSGKCINGNSYVFTDEGMIKIKDIPNYYNVNEKDECEANIISYKLNGEKTILPTLYYYDMGISNTIKITTLQGYEIEGTPEHKIIIVNSKGELIFKRLDKIKSTDIIAISLNNNLWGNNYLDLDICYLLGVLIGDGSLNGENRKTKSYGLAYSKSDNYMVNKINTILYNKIGVKNIRKVKKENSNTVDYCFGNSKIHNRLKQLGLSMKLSNKKEIPDIILSSKKECVIKFLQGLFDTDGSIDKSNRFEYCTASKELAEQVHVLLLNFGIRSNLREKRIKQYENNIYYCINIDSVNLFKFNKEIGFLYSKHKKDRLSNIKFNNINPNIDVLHNQNNNIKILSKQLKETAYYNKKDGYKIKCNDGIERSIEHVHDKRLNQKGKTRQIGQYLLKNILESINIDNELTQYLYNISTNFFFDEIKSIDNSECHVYDFNIPITHNFVANGFINHNTSLLKGILEILNNYSYATCTLSGKAAKRIQEATGLDSSTIHRLLQYNPKFGFMIGSNNPLDLDIVVLDEGSMVDNSLFYRLITGIKNGSKFIILADIEQLEPIGAGYIVKDIIESGIVPVVTLNKVHRQAEKSGILSCANKIRDGKQILKSNDYGNHVLGELKDLYIYAYKNRENVYNKIINICNSYSKSKDFNVMDFQVIVPMKNGNIGIKNLNKEIQDIFNPLGNGCDQGLKRGDIEFRINDKVIQCGNNYDKGVFNGSQGIVQWIDHNNRSLAVRFEEYMDIVEEDCEDDGFEKEDFGGIKNKENDYKRIKGKEDKEGKDLIIIYKSEDLFEIELAYALTVHRLQGSQCSNIVIGLDYSNYIMLSKQLIYTAMTRAEKYCFICCELNAFRYGIGNDKGSKRNTFLKEFLSEGMGEVERVKD